MTIVDDLLTERGTAANGRPLGSTTRDSAAPVNRILRFGERAEQMEQGSGGMGGGHDPKNPRLVTSTGVIVPPVTLEISPHSFMYRG